MTGMKWLLCGLSPTNLQVAATRCRFHPSRSLRYPRDSACTNQCDSRLRKLETCLHRTRLKLPWLLHTGASCLKRFCKHLAEAASMFTSHCCRSTGARRQSTGLSCTEQRKRVLLRCSWNQRWTQGPYSCSVKSRLASKRLLQRWCTVSRRQEPRCWDRLSVSCVR